MKVSDSSSSSIDYNKSLDEKLRNISKSKEAEIERVRKIYEKKVESAKSEGEDRYESALKRNDELIVGVGADTEQKLKSYKDSLDRTEKNIARTEESFKTDHAEKMRGLKEQYANNIEDEYFRANENQKAVQDQMKSSVQSIQNKSRNEQSQLESSSRAYINTLGAEFNTKTSNQERDYRSRLEADKLAQEDMLRNQRDELKARLDKNRETGKRLEQEKTQVQKEELSFLDNHQREMINQRNTDFKVRYENMVKEHEAILSQLKANLDADMKKMVDSSATQKKDVSNKLGDSFYRIETLNPSVIESEKELTVSLKVPEYEKENVHLSVHGRDLKLTLNRRYTDIMEANDGSTNRSTRNELFSKEFTSRDILDPKHIGQKYDKGVLTFKIQKA